ncbi:tondu-domain-containing Growth Inhibitor isoform X2 [Leptinotarsa decemlineata]|uniref:tondu-domain-containing Growth Inhibitor isoform X2 n=1 Tax=Leptinotarsa decemlineata TaxID=7539 RepID=UPI000C254F7B|nr:transcription cofactor vestigial-like protein 4 [Leptinotarsa decemlineata]XP_023019691.1 transcription cofactor vestigial-like protein 4 [Leptinotarsa decemlineata]
MEGGESPLDVLSRAATMVQENQSFSASDDGTKPYTKHTTKWKRERRQRPPEYPRKSDPKYSETFGADPSSPISYDLPVNAANSNGVKTSQIQPDSPLDMTVRQRGLPPSYAQTISNPGYRSSYRPSVIHNGVPPTREELPSGISMCDPIIDEHFRRSLGSDYHTVFRNNASKEKSPPKSPPKVENSPTTSVIELMDSTGLSVDDHFAKALGDTWAKLNRKEPEMKTSSSENGLVSI